MHWAEARGKRFHLVYTEICSGQWKEGDKGCHRSIWQFCFRRHTWYNLQRPRKSWKSLINLNEAYYEKLRGKVSTMSLGAMGFVDPVDL